MCCGPSSVRDKISPVMTYTGGFCLYTSINETSQGIGCFRTETLTLTLPHNCVSTFLRSTYLAFSTYDVQVRGSCLLPGSSGAGFLPPELTCVPCAVSAAGSVHVQGVDQCQRQGEGRSVSLLLFSQSFLPCLTLRTVTVSGWQLSTWLIPAVQALNVSSTAPSDLSALSGLLPQLGASFLLSLPSQQLIQVLSQPGLSPYTPAQVSGEVYIYIIKLCLSLCTLES